MNRLLSDDRLLHYLEGEVTASQAAEIEQTVAVSAPDAARKARLAAMCASLGECSPSLEGTDLVSPIREALTTGAAARAEQRRSPRLLACACALATALAATLLVLLVSRDDRSDEGFRARSDDSGAALDRWVAIDLYRVPAGGAPERLRDSIAPTDGILVSYVNGTHSLTHLAVFAVDGSARVYWLYPAWEDAEANPESIAIASDSAGPIELPDLVRHDLAAGPLVVYGLFTPKPAQVRRIERLVAEIAASGTWDPAAPPRIPIADSAQHVVKTRVTP